jgi:hypothetical protein
MVFWISSASIGQRLLSDRENIFKSRKPNRLRSEIGVVSAQWRRSTYDKAAYLSRLEWDIPAQLFPSHYRRFYMNESASCGLDSDIDFMKCCGMRTLAHECLVVTVACSA